ncbi:oxygenase MpaB family protein [Mucilaginibacter xinganensis]|uniref:ER-bound oxygenase mpaB/mpaB'/Rubber oxygenase catalytic domain-containing protein n=1 Tax=Mucilaginibacter xinganensis TaxID=1234841 RepID=A0A223NX53_9SPHI|nr:oxygenase MpaB family protein [Mucilaginibacter xinganensis]ASU34442.1 hypothetical protein MuYL_2555 [Mucilaginibacter xinganensis]
MENLFVDKDSIVRAIWGKADTVLFIFAGAAAEFALNKAVDWLYFTGRLPADPLGRLFSTLAYSHQIIFSKREKALEAIDRITGIHRSVEKNRGSQIPGQAYLNVLFLLIDYSIRSYELLERNLTAHEKEEVFAVFKQVGARMQLAGLPSGYGEYCVMREQYLRQNLVNSHFTADLYLQYKKHLGPLRFIILKQVQLILVPPHVKTQLLPNNVRWVKPVLVVYKVLRKLKVEGYVKNALLPNAYKKQVMEMEQAH